MKRLEEALYRNAGSKVRPRHAAEPASRCMHHVQNSLPPFLQEEYSDITTLEERLQQVARTYVSSKTSWQQQAQQQKRHPASSDPPGSQGGAAPSASTAAPGVLLQQAQQLYPGQDPGYIQQRCYAKLAPGAGKPDARGWHALSDGLGSTRGAQNIGAGEQGNARSGAPSSASDVFALPGPARDRSSHAVVR